VTTQIKAGRVVVLVDDADADLAAHTWHMTTSGYAGRNAARPHRGKIRMHRVIMRRVIGRELERWELVDHINGDRLDNRRANLRLATNSENMFNVDLPAHNTTGYKGVYRNSPTCRQPYQAAITVNRKKIYLGSFADPREAARAYDEAARLYAGPFARGNFQ
jgi:hypothetical protein